MFASELDRISTADVQTAANDSLGSQLVSFFRPRYERWLRDPRLSRTAMRLAFSSYFERANSEREIDASMVWTNLHQGIFNIIARSQRLGGVKPEIDASLAAKIVFSVYMTQVQLWVSQRNPNLEDVLETLSVLFDVVRRPLELTRSDPWSRAGPSTSSG